MSSKKSFLTSKHFFIYLETWISNFRFEFKTRYKISVTEEHLATIQLTTSKPDVYIKMTIYNNGFELLSVTGKGTAIIPAFIFMKDKGDTIADIASRPSSKTCKNTLSPCQQGDCNKLF